MIIPARYTGESASASRWRYQLTIMFTLITAVGQHWNYSSDFAVELFIRNKRESTGNPRCFIAFSVLFGNPFGRNFDALSGELRQDFNTIDLP